MPKNKRKPEQQENQGTEDGPHPSSREESIAVARGARYNPKIKLVAPLARYFMETWANRGQHGPHRQPVGPAHL